MIIITDETSFFLHRHSGVCLPCFGRGGVDTAAPRQAESVTQPARLHGGLQHAWHFVAVVEMEVTSKLESMLARIRGVKRLNSTSGNGYGNITVELDKHADVEAVRFEASTIIRQTWPQLPEGVSYPTIHMKVPDENASRPFMSFTLNAPSTPILIQQYAEEHIKPRLANIPGIYKVELSGATPMEWRLEYDSEQLRLLGVTLSDISEAVQRHYRKEFLGTHNVDTGNGSREWIRLTLVPESNSLGFNPAAITVTATDGKLLRLDELVSAVRMEEEPQSYYRING